MTSGWPDAETQDLQSRLHAWIHEAPAGFVCFATSLHECYGLSAAAGAALSQRFDSLALELFCYQYERVPVYQRWCKELGRIPSTVTSSTQIPALPVEAFRATGVHSFPSAATRAQFHTSGTSSAHVGTLVLDDLSLYETSLLRAFKHHVLPDCSQMQMLQLIPEGITAPHSSLAHMIDCVRQRWGTAQSRCFMDGTQLNRQALQKTLQRCAQAEEPVLLLGTAFAWVAFLDQCRAANWQVRLPAGSRLFETGGYKGRTRVLTRAQLLQSVEGHLGIAPSHVVSEYGMTEMGSQYYTLSLRAALLGQPEIAAPVWSYPSWLRPSLLPSEEELPLALDQAATMGLLLHHDLANRGSVAHLMTADLGIPRGNSSFELAGRAPVADLRGCGLVQEPLDSAQVSE